VSFLEAILERLGDRPERVAVAQGSGKQRQELSAGGLRGAVERARVALRAEGLRLGDRVALVAPNSAMWLAADLAVLAEGGVLVPFDPRVAEGGDLGELLADCDPRVIIYDPATDVPAVAQDGRGVARLTLEELSAGPTPEFRPARDVPRDSLCSLIYTSGSSGRPKGVMLTRTNLGFMLARTESRLAELTGLPFGVERALHYLPLCYAGSHVLALSCLLRGARLEVVADPQRLGEALGVAEADYFLNVPLVLERFERAAVAAVEAKGVVPARLLREARAAWERQEAGQRRPPRSLALGRR
jgi:long-subunit acyl-CoA synthetase (AMP-forming)